MRMCSVYFIRNEDGYVKVGHAKNPERRLIDLRIGSPLDMEVVGVIRARRDSRMESAVHGSLRDHWMRGEWYDIPNDVLEDIVSFGDALGDVYIEDAVGGYHKARSLVKKAASPDPTDREDARDDVKDAVEARVRENREANDE